jgi:hypothetical protein
VAVGATAVAVGAMVVAVAGTVVAVGGTAVLVGTTAVAVGVADNGWGVQFSSTTLKSIAGEYPSIVSIIAPFSGGVSVDGMALPGG